MRARAEALNALSPRSILREARPTLKKVLARRDECSARLRRSAVYILGRSGTTSPPPISLEVAKTDPDPSVRSDAIVLLGRSAQRRCAPSRRSSTRRRTIAPARAALSALKSKGGPEATRVLRTIIERKYAMKKCAEAVFSAREWRGQLDRILPGPDHRGLRSGGQQRRTVSDDP